MSYMRSSLIGGHVLWKDMPYRRTCLIGGHVLLEDMYYRNMSYGKMSYNMTCPT